MKQQEKDSRFDSFVTEKIEEVFDIGAACEGCPHFSGQRQTHDYWGGTATESISSCSVLEERDGDCPGVTDEDYKEIEAANEARS